MRRARRTVLWLLLVFTGALGVADVRRGVEAATTKLGAQLRS